MQPQDRFNDVTNDAVATRANTSRRLNKARVTSDPRPVPAAVVHVRGWAGDVGRLPGWPGTWAAGKASTTPGRWTTDSGTSWGGVSRLHACQGSGNRGTDRAHDLAARPWPVAAAMHHPAITTMAITSQIMSLTYQITSLIRAEIKNPTAASLRPVMGRAATGHGSLIRAGSGRDLRAGGQYGRGKARSFSERMRSARLRAVASPMPRTAEISRYDQPS